MVWNTYSFFGKEIIQKKIALVAGAYFSLNSANVRTQVVLAKVTKKNRMFNTTRAEFIVGNINQA